MSSDVNLSNTRESGRATTKGGRGGRSSISTVANGKAPASVTKLSRNCPWQIGQRVEACDSHGNWYPAKILDINDFKLLIHFQRWSSRFDEWFDMDSDLVRLIQESKKGSESVVFEVNDEVLARWTDSKLYPARIIKLFNDNVTCHVLFYDGYKKKVKLNAIEKLPQDYAGDRLPPKPQPKEQFTVVDPTNHNEYICDICKKGFRKECLLIQHKKHYHNIVEKSSSSNNSQQVEDNQTAISSFSNDTDNKDDVKPEIDQLKQKIHVKVENTSSDEQQQSNKTPTEVGMPTRNDVVVEIGKKRKSKDGRKSVGLNSPLFTPKRPKTEIGTSLPPSTNPYFYFYEPKSTKRITKPNLVLPFNIQNAQQIAEAHENDNIDEIVKCTCPIKEENGLMVQCELCLSWQHALCMGFTQEAEVPDDGYFCPFCRNPPKAYSSQRNSYQLNHWLKNALDPVFQSSCFTPVVVEPSQMSIGTHPKIVVKLESNSSTMFSSPNMMLSSSNPSLFDSYFPNTNASSFPNHSTITTTTTAANHMAISSVSNSNKPAAVSIGSFANLANGTTTTTIRNTTNEFDLPPSSGLFPSSFMDDDEVKEEKKNFMMHDHFSSHNNANLNMDVDPIGNLMDLKHDFFGDNKLMDDDEAFASQVKATNMLSSALLDIMNNIHSLNYKITHHKDVAAVQIMEKQEKLKENLKLLESKLERIEKEIEQKDSYAIHTSSSTLTATSPENFGFSDINCGLGLNNCSFAVSQTTTSHKTSFPSSIFESNHSSSSDQIGFTSTTPSGSIESQTLASLTNLPPFPPCTNSLDSSSFHSALLHNKLLSSSGPSLTSLNESSTVSTAFKTESPQLSQTQASKLELALPSTSTQPPPSLARLFIPPGNYSSSNDEQELIQNLRPSMTHDYLPFNMSDANMKLEIAYHYKDLNTAREIVLSLK